MRPPMPICTLPTSCSSVERGCAYRDASLQPEHLLNRAEDLTVDHGGSSDDAFVFRQCSSDAEIEPPAESVRDLAARFPDDKITGCVVPYLLLVRLGGR